METIFFLLMISAVFVTTIYIVRKIDARSYLVGGKIDKVAHELERVKQQLGDPVSQAELDYVEWFEARHATEKREHIGVAMMNDGFEQENRSSRLQAMH